VGRFSPNRERTVRKAPVFQNLCLGRDQQRFFLEILSIKYPEIAESFEEFREKTRQGLEERSKELKKTGLSCK